MSSKILGPGDPCEITLPSWRMTAKPAADPVQPDPTSEIARIEQRCEQRVAEARAAGMREGEAAGRSRASAELQPVIERLARSAEEIGGLRGRLRKEAESDVIRLSLAIARRILRRELAIDPEALRGPILGALEKLQAQEISRVRVHPSQVSAVSSCLRQATPGATIEVVGDPSRQPGAALFETNHGNLDASVETQLEEIERGLNDRLNRQS